MRLKTHLLTLAIQRSLPKHTYTEVLAGLILAGWGSRHEETGDRFLSNTEMHDVLLATDEEFRSSILWQVERWLQSEESGLGEKWSVMLSELLRDVWPRQISAKTPRISARLCDLAFSNVECFQRIAEIVLPLLTPIDSDRLMLHNILMSKDNIVDLYPRQTLAILYVVLPDNVALWPYGIEAILQRIGEADKSLKLDERLLELNRKWNSR